ncbi:MAG: tRNA/rRNA methyltransferase [Candidatus Falkowbacteria bacterium GW2011_GWA2_41_14]|uniref:tRNA/rRNA methyltransferase n=1 Tax=Candidatus Falkowbacteria bacterium GW2011_GWA2_41_14 TaxID=1618635 RepID=A0A0G0URR6_9BACT|nr:MAG: tRNA/rRNA methyltransferase [Candidatus Falkowbacteria bacterium GW2011_GWA2_41_14]
MSKKEIFIICHNIRSRHNVGSIFRTADAVGVSKIFLCGITPALPHPNIEKVSLGAEKFVEWEKCKETWRVIDRLKKEGVAIVSLEQAKNSIYLNDLKLVKKSFALILGEEVNGLPKTILKKSDKIIQIPMYGKKESLNVSVAFGIAVYKLRMLEK